MINSYNFESKKYYALRKAVFDSTYPNDIDNQIMWHYWKFNIWPKKWKENYSKCSEQEYVDIVRNKEGE